MGNSATIDLVGNMSPLSKSLKDSEAMLTGYGSRVTGVLSKIGGGIGSSVSNVTSGIFGAIRGAIDFGSEFVSAFAASEEAEKKLGATLRATGNAAGFTTDQLLSLSEQLQDVTKFEAETTQGAMGVLATFRNVRGDVFVDATKAAQDMSTVLGGDLSSSAMTLGKALNDPMQGISALSRAGVTFTETQKDLINSLIKSGDVMGAQKVILDELKNEFGGAAEAVGIAAAGRFAQVKNRFGDVQEAIGETILGVVDQLFPLIDGVATFAEASLPYIEDMAEAFISLGSDMVEYCQPAFEWLKDAGLTVFTGLEWAVANFDAVWAYTWKSTELSARESVGNIGHLLTEALPEYLGWLADNWANIFTDIANFNVTVYSNMATNIWDFVKSVKGYLTGDGEGFKFTSLLDGFESTLTELPQIADRVRTETEKQLSKEIDKLGDQLAGDFGERFNENQKALERTFAEKEKKVADVANNTASTDYDADGFKTKKDPKEKKAKEDKGEAAFVGLEELNRKISAAAAGRPVAEKQLDEQRRGNQIAEEQLEELRKKNEADGGDEAEADDMEAEAQAEADDMAQDGGDALQAAKLPPESRLEKQRRELDEFTEANRVKERERRFGKPKASDNFFDETDAQLAKVDAEANRISEDYFKSPHDREVDRISNSYFQSPHDREVDRISNSYFQSPNDLEVDRISNSYFSDALAGMDNLRSKVVDAATTPAETLQANNDAEMLRQLRDIADASKQTVDKLTKALEPSLQTAASAKLTADKIDNVGRLY
jgi:uncharacterized protein YukE